MQGDPTVSLQFTSESIYHFGIISIQFSIAYIIDCTFPESTLTFSFTVYDTNRKKDIQV